MSHFVYSLFRNCLGSYKNEKVLVEGLYNGWLCNIQNISKTLWCFPGLFFLFVNDLDDILIRILFDDIIYHNIGSHECNVVTRQTHVMNMGVLLMKC